MSVYVGGLGSIETSVDTSIEIVTPEMEKIAFAPHEAERYQVRLSKVGDNVQVTVEKNINTVAPADVARKVLGAIQDNLG